MRTRTLSAVFAACLLVTGCRGGVAGGSELDPALAFRLPSLAGGSLGPSDYPGQALVVEFWATWCTPCRAQAAILERLHREYASRGVAFLAVDVGEPEERVRAYAEKSPFPYPVVFDEHDELSAKLGIYALPTVLVLDQRGAMVYFESGLSTESVLRQVLDRVLGTGL